MINKLKNKNGFTLVEILLYVSIVSVMVTVIASFFGALIEANAKTQTINEVDGNANQIIQIFRNSVSNATLVNSPSIGTSGTTLSINTADGTKNPTVFSLNGSTLNIKESTGADVPLTSNRVTISNLSFSNLSQTGTKGTIRMQFTLSHVNPDNRSPFRYSQTYYATATLKQQ